jgi:hypothetical protein
MSVKIGQDCAGYEFQDYSKKPWAGSISEKLYFSREPSAGIVKDAYDNSGP